MNLENKSRFLIKTYNNLNHGNIKISFNKLNMVNFCNATKELQILKKTMHNNINSLDIWGDGVNYFGSFKSQIENIVKQCKNNFKSNFKRKLRKRYYSRKTMEENKKKWITFKNMSLTKKRKLINYIDTFIEEKKNELVWEKEKHMLRKDADIVLLDVQTKRTEVRKFLNTIQEVENLKKTQVEVLKLRGSRILAEADTFFNNIIEY
ncbi:uncharacterized protein LOC116416453 isoform X2 [Nasonia vitripennis]|uniref:Uncharacterized protein n=1 Tax=Nasonia vitripennis TaxID=7425 RepID=A0A7M7Q2X7_NASVI|nr:uncharacterized protein LOC116416453 isoform X2 [Nasonia vitripennis]